jgi:F1F0 ATPase subunit 2
LWFTVRALAGAKRPVSLLMGSLVLRAAACAFGFYLIMDGRWERLAAALVGFLVARGVLLRRLGPARRPDALQVRGT